MTESAKSSPNHRWTLELKESMAAMNGRLSNVFSRLLPLQKRVDATADAAADAVALHPPEAPSSPTDHQDHHQDHHHLEGLPSEEEGRRASHLKRWRPRSSKAQQQQHFVIGRFHSHSDSHRPPLAPARPLLHREAPEEETLATISPLPQVHRQGERQGAASKTLPLDVVDSLSLVDSIISCRHCKLATAPTKSIIINRGAALKCFH
ncbi:hypothetical protein TYRP_017081, partial [Tyrophagus putrescentiae]